MIVDEAQKVEKKEREIILEESIQQIIKWNPNSQFVFISPFTDTPILNYLNIAGRSGHLMKYLSGNIYEIDIDNWHGYDPTRHKTDINRKEKYVEE